MRRTVFLVMAISFLLLALAEPSYCRAAKLELDWDYMTPFTSKRQLHTVSLHMLEKISQTDNRSVYRGLTITRPYGNIINTHEQTLASSAAGIGPVYMVRNEKYHSGKLTMAIDMSGGFIIYDKVFPAGGRWFNFMWRFGPQFIYKIDENSSINIGYMVMHVSNGFKTHNPSYNAHGVSVGFTTNF